MSTLFAKILGLRQSFFCSIERATLRMCTPKRCPASNVGGACDTNSNQIAKPLRQSAHSAHSLAHMFPRWHFVYAGWWGGDTSCFWSAVGHLELVFGRGSDPTLMLADFTTITHTSDFPQPGQYGLRCFRVISRTRRWVWLCNYNWMENPIGVESNVHSVSLQLAV